MTPLAIALISSGAAAAVALIIVFLYLSNNLIARTNYRVEFGGVEEELKIVQISDLHGKSFGRGNIKLLKKVMEADPDVIAVTGDIIHDYSKKGVETALSAVSALAGIAPVLYVSGNHEMRNIGYSAFRKQLAAAGAVVLDDRSAVVRGVTFVGLNGANNKNGTLAKITPNESHKILLAHMPQHVQNYAACGYDVALSGHAHGGQWRIPFTDIGIYAPGQGLFPKLTSGVHKVGSTRLIISRGLGNSQFPVRLFNRPELVVITLVPEK